MAKSVTRKDHDPGHNFCFCLSIISRHTCSSYYHPPSDHSVWKSYKKSHSALRAKRAMFTFEETKIVNLESLWNHEAFGQTVLPDRTKLVENAKIENSNETILLIFKQCERGASYGSKNC